MSHNKYHETDYTRKWGMVETNRLMKMAENGKDWDAIGEILGRSHEACKHRWRTVVASVEFARDGRPKHRWTKRMITRARKLMDKGIFATEIARRLRVTKYAVWHKTKSHA